VHLCLLDYPPTLSFGGFGRVRVFSLDQYYIFIILNMISFLIQIWAIRILCTSVFSVGDHIREWNLLRDIILFYLSGLFKILVCPKGFLLWPLVGTEKIEMRSAGLSEYSVGSHLFIFCFDTFTGCSPLTLSWYSIGSHLFLICQFTGSYLLLTIWQLKTYLSIFFHFIRWIIRFSRPEYVPLHAHSTRALSPREPELSVYAVLAPHKHKVLSS
jgi:hypothetical protein